MPRCLTATLLGLLALALACSSTPESPSSDDTFDLEQMLEREADPIALHHLEAPNGYFRVSVPARPESEIKLLDGYYEIFLDIGSDAPIGCFLYPDGVDLATNLVQLSAAILEEQEAVGEIEAKQISGLEAGVIEGAPYMGVQWLYRALQNGQLALGQASTLIAKKRGFGLVCVQNELGFEQTLMRVFRQLVSSLEMESSATVPYYEEVAVLKLGEQEVGLQLIEFTRDEDSDTRIETTTAMAIPRSATDLLTSDASDVQFSTEEGSLINQVSVSSDNGEISMNLNLDPGPDGAWVVNGIFEHKEISGTIPEQPLDSTLGQMRTVRDLIARADAGSEVSAQSWVAGADPVHLIEWKVRYLEQIGENRHRLEASIGPISITGISDSAGSLISGQLNMGPMVLEIERIHRLGAF